MRQFTMMGPSRSFLLWILISLAVTVLSSCTIGIRKEVRVVYVSFAETEEATKGAIRIATNSTIPVTVGDNHVDLNLGGYYVISAADLKAFVEAIRARNP